MVANKQQRNRCAGTSLQPFWTLLQGRDGSVASSGRSNPVFIHIPSCAYVVARIALVSPDRARQIEAILLRMAQTGQLRGRVSEAQLIELLDQVCSFHPSFRIHT